MDYETKQFANEVSLRKAKLFSAVHCWIIIKGRNNINWKKIGEASEVQGSAEYIYARFVQLRQRVDEAVDYPPIIDIPSGVLCHQIPDSQVYYTQKGIRIETGEMEKFKRAMILVKPWVMCLKATTHFMGYHPSFPGYFGSISNYFDMMTYVSETLPTSIKKQYDKCLPMKGPCVVRTEEEKRKELEKLIKNFQHDESLFVMHTLSRNILPNQHVQSYFLIKYRRGSLLNGYGGKIREVMSDYELLKVHRLGMQQGFDFENLDPKHWSRFLQSLGIRGVDGVRDFYTFGMPRINLLRKYLEGDAGGPVLKITRNVKMACVVIYHYSADRCFLGALRAVTVLTRGGIIDEKIFGVEDLHFCTFMYLLTVFRGTSEEFFASTTEFAESQGQYVNDIVVKYGKFNF